MFLLAPVFSGAIMSRVLIDAAYQHAEIALGFTSVREGSSFSGLDAGELAGINKQYLNTKPLSNDLTDLVDVIVDEKVIITICCLNFRSCVHIPTISYNLTVS